MAVDMIFWSGNGQIHGDRKGGSALIKRLSDNVEKMWNFVGVMEVLRGINHVDMILDREDTWRSDRIERHGVTGKRRESKYHQRIVRVYRLVGATKSTSGKPMKRRRELVQVWAGWSGNETTCNVSRHTFLRVHEII